MSRWNNQILDAARFRADPSADVLIHRLFSTGSVDEANRLFTMIQQNDQGVPDYGPPELTVWLRETAQLPAWYDPEKARAGQELFQRNGLAVVMALFNRALPETYLGAKGVKVLYLTHQLTRDPARRILETAQLVFDVCEPGGFDAGGQALRSCQKVRLLHAGVRYLLKHHPELWQADGEEPINQEDAAGTIQAFSSMTLRSLETMGYDFTEEEATGYMHLWKIAGYMLGVEEQFLTESYEEGKVLTEWIARRQFRSSPEGMSLAAALLKAEAELLPGTIADGAPLLIMRWLLGDEYADMLGIKKIPLVGVMMRPLAWINHLVDEAGDESALTSAFLVHFNRALTHGLYRWNLKNRKVEFRISERLSQKWGLS